MLEKGRMRIRPPRHIAWSTEVVDLADPFQRRWYIRQVLLKGTAQDIRTLDLDEVERLLDELGLPIDIYSLWSRFLATRHPERTPGSAAG
jgi:hypothetical protein